MDQEVGINRQEHEIVHITVRGLKNLIQKYYTEALPDRYEVTLYGDNEKVIHHISSNPDTEKQLIIEISYDEE